MTEGPGRTGKRRPSAAQSAELPIWSRRQSFESRACLAPASFSHLRLLGGVSILVDCGGTAWRMSVKKGCL